MPTDEQRRRAVSRDNPQSPFAKVKGNEPALRVFQDIAFDALGRPDHLCRDKVLVLLGSGRQEKAEIAWAFAQAVELPLVTIDSNATRTLDDFLAEVGAVMKAEGVPLVEVVRQNYFVIPPCVIFLTEASDLRGEVVQGVVRAINDDPPLLSTESGKSVNCHNACWVLADVGESVSSLLTQERKVVLDVVSADTLRKWKESGEPRRWVEAHNGRWDHEDWLNLISSLEKSQYWPMEAEAVRAVLVDIKQEWEKRQQPHPTLPAPAKPAVPPPAPTANPVPLPGISDPAAARQAAQKKAAVRCHAVAVETRRLSEEEHPVFSGDAPCPKCKTILWVEWKNTTVTMKCPNCGHRFDGEQAVAFLSAYKPEDNFKPQLASVALEAPEVLERLKALEASEEAARGRDILELAKALLEGQQPPPAHKPQEAGMDGEPAAFDTVCLYCLTEYAVRCRVGAVARCQDCLRDFPVYRRVPGHYSRKSAAGKLVSLFNPLAGLNPLAREKCPECGAVAAKVGVQNPGPQWVGDQLISTIAVFYRCDSCKVIWAK